MVERSPDPLDDPLGYALWLDMHQCPICKGEGEHEGGYRCEGCDGSGIDSEYVAGDFFAGDEWE